MKKNIILSAILLFAKLSFGQTLSAENILKKVDANMVSKNRIMEAKMIIHGQRNDREISSKSYSEGIEKSFTEYLSPEREKGTKMLKMKNMLWIYTPATDRTIQLSGHLLRQSVMGSDLSYEDMMETRKLYEIYDAKILKQEKIDDRNTWLLELNATVEDVAYVKSHIWIDTEKFVPLKQDFYAKSGQLLKRSTFSDIDKINGRWYPKKINYKDMLKNGKGTDFIMLKVSFDTNIPDYIFSKASLKK
ncbi:MAG: outer membrane lipoprotein-sorting protein [Cytophagaceae bacterium]|nr:outer membrane lipoprotein-sorting protein [Cytophagaceae bacterium]